MAEAVFRSTRRFLQSHTYRMTPRNRNAQLHATPCSTEWKWCRTCTRRSKWKRKTDSTALKRLFYRGEVGDDHGFKRLLFHYRFVSRWR